MHLFASPQVSAPVLVVFISDYFCHLQVEEDAFDGEARAALAKEGGHALRGLSSADRSGSLQQHAVQTQTLSHLL